MSKVYNDEEIEEARKRSRLAEMVSVDVVQSLIMTLEDRVKKARSILDPRIFEILAIRDAGTMTIALIDYTVGGEKVLIFKDLPSTELRKMMIIDPRLQPNIVHAPIAEFAPTREGWQNGLNFCFMAGMLEKKQQKSLIVVPE